MASEAIKKIGVQNEDGTYSYTDIGADASKITINDTTLDKKLENIEESISDKVDKVEGKELSTNDYTDEDKDKVDNAIQTSDIDTELNDTSENPVQNKIINEALNSKVDKIEGKSLSTNDYTDEDKAKVASIGTGGGSGSVGSLTDLGVTATAEELNTISGIQGSVQTQIDGKAPIDHSSDNDKYGLATNDKWGHVQVKENYKNNPDVSIGQALSTMGAYNFYTEVINKINKIEALVVKGESTPLTLSYIIHAYEIPSPSSNFNFSRTARSNFLNIENQVVDSIPGLNKYDDLVNDSGVYEIGIMAGSLNWGGLPTYYCKSQSDHESMLLSLARTGDFDTIPVDVPMAPLTNGNEYYKENIFNNTNNMITKNQDLADCEYFKWTPLNGARYVLNNALGKLYLYQ